MGSNPIAANVNFSQPTAALLGIGDCALMDIVNGRVA
jgi:hypothetical protein